MNPNTWQIQTCNVRFLYKYFSQISTLFYQPASTNSYFTKFYFTSFHPFSSNFSILFFLKVSCTTLSIYHSCFYPLDKIYRINTKFLRFPPKKSLLLSIVTHDTRLMPTHDACPRLIIDCFVPALREETPPTRFQK